MEKQGAEGSLKKRLLAYAESDYYGFHMPGHKRQMGELGNPYQIDITEIDGFDDLHHPQAQGGSVQGLSGMRIQKRRHGFGRSDEDLLTDRGRICLCAG